MKNNLPTKNLWNKMSSLYIHIPFCIRRCHYCNFFSSTLIEQKNSYIKALKKEIQIRSNYLKNKQLKTIYIGGGTPSLLSIDEINSIFKTITDHFYLAENIEISLEANPNNLNEQYLSALQQTPVNRLSIGIQSFFDEHLQVLGRIHSTRQAHLCIQQALQAGFDNLSIDLMYGYPHLTLQQWKENLHFVKDIPHISCYCLTLEPHSQLYKTIQQKQLSLPDDDHIIEQIEVLKDFAHQHQFIHYEISNFCKENFHSRHNSAYWQRKPYLGIGCSAHSFDIYSRQWNICNINSYIEFLDEINTHGDYQKFENRLFEREILTPAMQVNEYIMTSLRTIYGCHLDYIAHEFSPAFAEQLAKKISLLQQDNYIFSHGILRLTEKGMLFADAIAAELFFDENDYLTTNE